MNTYLLRCEGVNFSNFVEDTQDLSTIRGGSLLLLHSVGFVEGRIRTRLQDELKSVTPPGVTGGVKLVSKGASAGLFEISLPDSINANQVLKAVTEGLEADLKQDPSPDPHVRTFKHATFVVDAVPTKGDPALAVEKALARNRVRQMHQPSLAIPSWNHERSVTSGCDFDHVRPATRAAAVPKGSKRHDVSEATFLRHNYGKGKKKFFKDYAGPVADDMDFVWDLDKLTSNLGKGNLHHKMAVLYADGNDFGGVEARHCGTLAGLELWDGTLEQYRKELLAGLLLRMKGDPATWKHNDCYQIETLLWGGDDLIWVVPAWQGWETATYLFESTAKWQFQGEHLKHAAGLVFCHHKAPIHRVTALARDLAKLAKHDRGSNLFAYEVLESFDDAPRDERRRPERHFVPGGNPEQLVLRGDALSAATVDLTTLKEAIPRSRLVALVLALHRGQPVAARHEAKLLEAIGTAKPALDRLERCFAQPPALWFHLAELWDYVGS